MPDREIPTTRWQYFDPALLWLLPAAYVLHLAEEQWAGEGLVRWITRLGGTLTADSFVTINGVMLPCMIGGIFLATRRFRFRWLGLAFGTLLFVNALAHLGGSVVTRSYSPGLVTGITLYVPLGVLVLLRAWHQAPPGTFWAGVAAGVALQLVAAVIVFA